MRLVPGIRRAVVITALVWSATTVALFVGWAQTPAQPARMHLPPSLLPP